MRQGWFAGLLAVAALTACGAPSDDALEALVIESPPPPPPDEDVPNGPVPECDPTASFRPEGPNPAPGHMPVGTAMHDVLSRGRLLVGVDENTQGLAYRDPDDGEIKGMEVDLAYEIARRIFGDRPAEEIVKLVPVTTDEKIDVVEDGTVDLTIDAVSMSCRRWQDVDFSTEYLTAEQQFLVRTDSSLRSADDLDGSTICVTEGSSSAGILRQAAPQAALLEVGPRTDCLVALQQGTADAYFGHDTFLLGMKLQDRTTEIRDDILPPDVDTTSHYGIAIAKGNEDLVRFVNRALEEMRADGTWDRLHDGLEAELGLLDASPPVAAYRTEEP